jgi:heptosyltransferase-2
MSTPLLRAVRARYAAAEITLLAEPNLRGLIRGGKWMNDVVEWPSRDRRRPWHGEHRAMVKSLRGRRFDWAVLLPNSFRSAMLARLCGAKRRIGYDRDGRGLLLTDRIPVRNREGRQFKPMRLVDYYGDLAEAIGCPWPGDRLELFTTPDGDESATERLESWGIADRRPLVVISPGAKYGAAKCWLPDRFAAAADRLIAEHGAAVVITCGPGEEAIAREIRAAMKHDAAVTGAPLLSLGALKSLIARADLLLCNDAGPRHIAKAFQVPVVTVFGPTHPEWTATRYPAERIVRIDIDCGPCQQRVCPLGHMDCMRGVTVDAVVDACRVMLAPCPARVPV